RQPHAAFLIKESAEKPLAAMHQRDVCLRTLRQYGSHFRCNSPAPHDDDLLFRLENLRKTLHVTQAPQVKNVAKVRAGNLRAPRPASRGKTRLLEFHSLAVAKDRELSLQVELRDDRAQP